MGWKSLDNNKNQTKKTQTAASIGKYLWLRHAIFEKHLAKILDYLVRRDTSGAGSTEETSPKSFHMSAREYVESLHQNSKLTLLYGKNNVLVQPREDTETLAGYLSLHQSSEGLVIMWTPNQLMNGCCDDTTEETDRSIYWDFAMTIYVDEIVYIHCHQQPDCRGTVVLVGQDGVQRPPIHFPKGGHLLSFLSCLENGLLPHGKVFPKLRRKASSRSSNSSTSSGSTTSMEDEEATDYVFRIITTFKPDSITPEMMDPKAKSTGEPAPFPVKRQLPRSPLATTSAMQTYARTQEEQNHSCLTQAGPNHRAHIKQLCDTMTKQIISRAFYGWLAHCRHLKTVRTHLSGLVYHAIVAVDDPVDASAGLTTEKWADICVNGVVWPYLLGHYKFKSTPQERACLDDTMRQGYERIMSEWLAVEAIIRQRDKEVIAANIAKLSQESTDGHIPLVRKDSSLSNDVFESFESEEFSHPETVLEESSTAMTTPTDEQRVGLELGQKVSQTDVATSTTSSPRLFKVSIEDSPDDGLGDSIARGGSLTDRSKLDSMDDTDTVDSPRPEGMREKTVVTKLSVDSAVLDDAASTASPGPTTAVVMQDFNKSSVDADDEGEETEGEGRSSDGLKAELLDSVALNLHRIDKDVQRCDRHYWYFSDENLEKLRNIMCTYVWQHLEILDAELFEHMHQHGDYTHFYFCYRWFLLDFKRELLYPDVFSVWETIWAAKHISSSHFVLFIALALVEFYRDIILDNNMDFTDIIKFFNGE
nr:hypothetical protein BaRGS_026693 [Batillaria attramentaria]